MAALAPGRGPAGPGLSAACAGADRRDGSRAPAGLARVFAEERAGRGIEQADVMVQVKYEMLRRRRVDGRGVTEIAGAFGVSRQAFYAAEAAITQAGLPGLLPRRRGPKRAHKCTDEILDFVEHQRADDPSRSAVAVVEAVRRRFSVAVHPRSLARALVRKKTALPDRGGIVRDTAAETLDFVEQYETLRREALEIAPFAPRGQGLALFLARGLSSWLQALTRSRRRGTTCPRSGAPGCCPRSARN
jgi:hypothetical protein